MLVKAVMFPSTGLQVLSAFVHFLGVSVLAHCISRRLAVEDLSSFSGLRNITWPRLCIILVFIDSWLFLFASGVLVFGVGLELNNAVCSTAVYFCISFYATSKILIYAFLVEKVHVVWSPTVGAKRFKSRIYIGCLVTLALYVIVIGLMMLVGNIHHLRSDGVCVIGLKPTASIPLLTYDFFINVCLTGFFLWPLFRSNVLNPTIRRVTTRTLIAASVALTTSTINILVLTLVHGKQLGWLCLGSCGSDVILNAFALFWATGSSPSSLKGSGVVVLPEQARPIFIDASPFSRKDGSSIHTRKDTVCELSQPRSAVTPCVQLGTDKDASRMPNSALASVLAWFSNKEENENEKQAVQVTVITEMDTFTAEPSEHRRSIDRDVVAKESAHCVEP